MSSTSRITRSVLLGLGAFLFACTDSPTGPRTATVIVRLMTPATVASVTVEVSGPGITPAVIVNIPVGADSVASDTLTVTAGSGRRFVVTAVDTAGVQTHRADTTITLVAGANAPLVMRLDPLAATLGITVTFGGVTLTVADTSTRILLVGDSLQIAASATEPSGAAVPAGSLQWGSSNPAFATVDAEWVRGVRKGVANIVVSHRGAVAGVRVEVWDTLPNTVMEVSSGGQYSCARRYDGGVDCWGTLPIGAGGYLAQPTRVAPDKKWASFSTGFSMLCGVTFEHEAFCWGNNSFGQLGTGATPSNVDFATPQPLDGGRLWTEIAVGIYAGCASTYPEKSVYCWGGVGNSGAEGPFMGAGSASPVQLPGGSGFSGLVVGSAHACALRLGDGLPFCWGDAALFPADGSPALIEAPEALSRSFAIGTQTVCSVTATGAAYCFGINDVGQLTGGGAVSALIPAASPSLVGASITWSRFFGGRTTHFCGVATDSTGYCWGTNVSGQVGDGTTGYRTSPVAVPGKWLVLAPGLGATGAGNQDHTCGLSVAREVYCWGFGAGGELGSGGQSPSLTPVRVVIP